ncbi:MAG: leucine-rich repeat protein, partial [Bacillus sp. (in: Bacteria)]|nr:leucine-rich repeat protein [Bacillus sp. (in: firmicutes)]
MEIAEFTGTFMQEEFKPGICLRLGKDEEYAYWRVLDINKEQETALLMAERSLRVKPYHNEHRAITWENCSLRAWLNDEYYEKTFSEKEKAAIIETPHEFLSRDKVFLLSTSEAKDYLSDEHDRTARYYSGWLRSPGSYSDNAACIDNNGSINYLGCNVVCLKTFCPAICIDLNSDLFRSLVLSDSSDAIIIRTPELLIKDGQVISANPGVKDVEVPFGVSVIKKNAFMNCMRLTSVKIPESVTRIEPCSFQGSNELVIASIPEKVSIVGSFDYCKKLDVVMIYNGAKRRVLAFAQNSTGRTNLDDYGKSDFWQRYDLEIINNGPQYKFRSPARLLAAAGRLSDPIGMSNASREAYIAMLKGNEKKVITFAKKYDIPEAVQALLENGLVQEENLKTLRKLLAGSQNLHIAELATAKLKLEESTEKRQISSIDMEYGEKFEKAGGNKAL